MFVLVQHSISDPAIFWNTADPRNNLPPNVKLHHTFPTPDGTRAVCIWEAESVDARPRRHRSAVREGQPERVFHGRE